MATRRSPGAEARASGGALPCRVQPIPPPHSASRPGGALGRRTLQGAQRGPKKLPGTLPPRPAAPPGAHPRVQPRPQRGRCALSPSRPSTVLPVGSSRASHSPPSALRPGAPSLPQGNCRGQNSPLLGPLGSLQCSPVGPQLIQIPAQQGPREEWTLKGLAPPGSHTHTQAQLGAAECQPPDSGRASTLHTAESQAGSRWAVPRVLGAPTRHRRRKAEGESPGGGDRTRPSPTRAIPSASRAGPSGL